MFFRYGMQPTANKVYQLVRKGTVATPAQAVTEFWKELRAKSRVAIQHPGLPEDLSIVAGDAFSLLWNAALEAANKNYEAVKVEYDQHPPRCKQESIELRQQLLEAQTANMKLTSEVELSKIQLQDACNQSMVDAQLKLINKKLAKEQSIAKSQANKNESTNTQLEEKILRLQNQLKAIKIKAVLKEGKGNADQSSSQIQNELDL